MGTIGDLDELRRDAKPVPRLPHASFKQVRYAQNPPDFPSVFLLSFECKRGSPRYDVQMLGWSSAEAAWAS